MLSACQMAIKKAKFQQLIDWPANELLQNLLYLSNNGSTLNMHRFNCFLFHILFHILVFVALHDHICNLQVLDHFLDPLLIVARGGREPDQPIAKPLFVKDSSYISI